jgi:hypothetical protein
MVDFYFRHRVSLGEQVELLPSKGFLLTAPIDPLEKDSPRSVQKLRNTGGVERHAEITHVPG